MVSALDEAVGNVTAVLKEKGILDDAVLFFTTDVNNYISYSRLI